MGDISNHISRRELACRCGCGFSAADAELVRVVEECMDHFEEVADHRLVVTFTSGNRCQLHNGSIPGAAAGSFHTKGLAVDFRIGLVHEDKVADYLEKKYPDRYGIGRYPSRTHLDVRQNKARWDKRGKG